jgi:aminoglycoside phosphotransferase (APT) family kinase protein
MLLGHAVARAHLPVPATAAQPVLFSAKLPWILQLNAAAVQDIRERATRALLEVARTDVTLTQRLRALEAAWKPTTLMHGDAKLDNVLVRMSERPRVWIVDWAFAGVGDPAWDVGSMLQSSLLLWLYGVPFQAGVPFEDAVARSSFPITLAQAFTREFLRSYRATRTLSDPAWGRFVLRAVRYSGAALIQSALADARTSEHYSPRQLALLQTGACILAKPGQALRHFFDAR